MVSIFDDKGRIISKWDGRAARRRRTECPSCPRNGLEKYRMTTRTEKYLDLFFRCCDGMGGLNVSVLEWQEMPIDLYNAFGMIMNIRAEADGKTSKNQS